MRDSDGRPGGGGEEGRGEIDHAVTAAAAGEPDMFIVSLVAKTRNLIRMARPSAPLEWKWMNRIRSGVGGKAAAVSFVIVPE